MANNALIIARDLTNIIAINGSIPWYCPEDMAHFKRVSLDFDFIIMGRATYTSLLAVVPNVHNPLPSRKCLVLSSNPTRYVSTENVKFISYEQCLKYLNSKYYCLVIGGAKTAMDLLPHIDSVFLSTIKEASLVNKKDKVTYFHHSFTKGLDKQHKFELELAVNYSTFKLDLYGRRTKQTKNPSRKRNALDTDTTDIKDRVCLACSHTFVSVWIGNRICDVCKGTWDYKINKDLPEEHYFPEEY